MMYHSIHFIFTSFELLHDTSFIYLGWVIILDLTLGGKIKDTYTEEDWPLPTGTVYLNKATECILDSNSQT